MAHTQDRTLASLISHLSDDGNREMFGTAQITRAHVNHMEVHGKIRVCADKRQQHLHQAHETLRNGTHGERGSVWWLTMAIPHMRLCRAREKTQHMQLQLPGLITQVNLHSMSEFKRNFTEHSNNNEQGKTAHPPARCTLSWPFLTSQKSVFEHTKHQLQKHTSLSSINHNPVVNETIGRAAQSIQFQKHANNG